MTAESPPPVLLYAEDDKLIQRAMVQTLEEAGFELIVADDGAQALDVLANEQGPIDGLVTDVNLGDGPNGWEVARGARQRSPRMPVLYASSVTEDEWLADGVPLSKLLAKPFRPSRVIDSIRGMLAGATARMRNAVEHWQF